MATPGPHLLSVFFILRYLYLIYIFILVYNTLFDLWHGNNQIVLNYFIRPFFGIWESINIEKGKQSTRRKPSRHDIKWRNYLSATY